MRKLLFGVLMLIPFELFAQRYPTKRSYEIIGLPDGSEIGDALKIAIPLLIIGFLITYIFMWRKKAQEEKENNSQYIGCLGVILMAVGAFFLIPLLAWVEAIFVSALGIVIALVVVAVIIGLIYSFFKK
jgi:hypothetical protein